MKKKIAMKIALVILFVVVVTFSGCIEGEGEQWQWEDTEDVKVVRSETPTMPTTQNINGNYKVQDVSGNTININGNYNEIMILNLDVSLIRVNGNYNTVYYPKEAIPTIKENGSENAIKTY